jgi:hypothetical protein
METSPDRLDESQSFRRETFTAWLSELENNSKA